MFDTPLNGKKLPSRLDNCIKKAFAFPFYTDEHCKPDDGTHSVPARTFHLNGHFVVLYNIRLFPGLTFRALKASTGDLNVYTQDVEFEVEIPTIGGYFYTVSDDKSVKPVHQRGSFKINYGTAIAKGITIFFLNCDRLGMGNMTMDFELVQEPRVTLYSHEADGSLGPLDSNPEDNGMKVAQVLWPSVKPVLYWIFRGKLEKIGYSIPWHDRIRRIEFTDYENRRRGSVFQFLNEIMPTLKRKLREKTIAGRLPMPDIDVMVAAGPRYERSYRGVWGRFKATSGWLGDIASMRVRESVAVHARSKNELVIVGQIYFNDWKYCYDEYEMEANKEKSSGEIIATLGNNEAIITLTAVRNDEGVTVVKNGRFEYINATNIDYEVTRLNNLYWVEKYVTCWMSGLMDEGTPVLNDTVTDCLNEVLVDVDIFAIWDGLCEQGVVDGMPKKSEDYSADRNYEDSREADSARDPTCDDWEQL